MKKIKPISLIVLLHVVFIAVALMLLVRQKGAPVSAKEKIVVVPIEGVISINANTVVSGDTVDNFVKKLKEMEEDADLKAIVLRINSPGGSIAAVQEIYAALKKIRAKGKIVVSSFGDVAASGGYYIACGGDKIVSNPGTLTGSIGVIMQMPNFRGLLDKFGVSFETIKSGDFKDSGSPFRKMTDDERKYFQEIVLDAYDQFYTVVQESRKMTPEELKPLADGRVFSGRMAHNKRLVDEVGGLQEAIELAKKLTNLTDKKPQIIYQRDRSPFDKLLKMVGYSPIQKIEQLADSSTQVLYLMK